MDERDKQRLAKLDESVAKLAKDNDNVVTRPDLIKLGFTDHMIETNVRRRRWQQLQRGVYLLGAAAPTWRQQIRAAMLAAGPDSQISHPTAPALWGLDGASEGAIELTVPHGKHPEPRDTVVHRSTAMGPPRTTPDGIRTPSIERVLIDYASCVGKSRLERAVESALTRGLTSQRRLWIAVKGGESRLRGAVRLARVLAERPAGKPARSVLEIEVLRVIRESGLPIPTRNHDTYVDGEHFEIDLAYIDSRAAIEADSVLFHGTASQQRRDRRRQDRLETAGWLFVRVTWRDVFDRPEWVVEQIRGAILKGCRGVGGTTLQMPVGRGLSGAGSGGGVQPGALLWREQGEGGGEIEFVAGAH